MMPTQLSKRLVNRYKELVENFYFEPPDNDIIGSFVQSDDNVPNTSMSNGKDVSSKKKTKNTRYERDEVGVKDIRSFFKKTGPVKSTTACSDNIIILDD